MDISLNVQNSIVVLEVFEGHQAVGCMHFYMHTLDSLRHGCWLPLTSIPAARAVAMVVCIQTF